MWNPCSSRKHECNVIWSSGNHVGYAICCLGHMLSLNKTLNESQISPMPLSSRWRIFFFSAFFSLFFSFYKIILIRQHKLYTRVGFPSSVLRKQEYGHLMLCNREKYKKSTSLLCSTGYDFQYNFPLIHSPTFTQIYLSSSAVKHANLSPTWHVSLGLCFTLQSLLSLLCCIGRFPLLNCPN